MILTVLATDPDYDALMYSISSNPPFSIDSFSGAITLSASLDYETTQQYVNITITATDSDGNTGTARLDVNDNPPLFSNPLGYSQKTCKWAVW